MAAPATPFSPLELLLILLGAALLLRGVWGLWRSRRSRIGDTPHCPRCDYILTGLPVTDAAPTRCPECGATLTPHTIVRGERGRSGRWLAAHLLVGWVGLIMIAAVLVLTAANIDWIRHRPFSWLLKDLGKADVATATRSWNELQRRAGAGELSPGQQSAWVDRMLTDVDPKPKTIVAGLEEGELSRRAAAGSLTGPQWQSWADHLLKQLDATSSTLQFEVFVNLVKLRQAGHLSPAQNDALTDRELREQATDPRPPLPFFATVMTELGRQYLAGDLSDAQRKRFTDDLIRLTIATRPRVRATDRIPYLIYLDPRGPEGWRMRVQYKEIYVDGKVVSHGGGAMSGSMGGGSTGSTIDPQPVGRHALRVTVDLKAGPPLSENDPEGLKPIVERTELLDASTEVVPTDAADIHHVTDPSAATIAKHVKPTDFTYEPGDYEPLRGMVDLNGLPVNAAFDVIARVNGKEYPLGSVALAKGKQTTFGVGAHDPAPPATPTLDLSLRSSDAAARGTVDLTEIWQGEITIPNVPVKQLPPRKK